jgi:flagellar hook-associated protein 3 FlgL
VIWYKGDDTAADPRQTATLQVSPGESIGVGLQANEPAFRSALAGIAVMASVGFSAADTDNARFAAFGDRVRTLLKPGDGADTIQEISTDLSLASSRLDTQKSQNSATRAVLENAVDGIENVTTEEVAAKLLTLQTQLQASYQTTSTLAKLSLVNYM